MTINIYIETIILKSHTIGNTPYIILLLLKFKKIIIIMYSRIGVIWGIHIDWVPTYDLHTDLPSTINTTQPFFLTILC